MKRGGLFVGLLRVETSSSSDAMALALDAESSDPLFDPAQEYVLRGLDDPLYDPDVALRVRAVRGDVVDAALVGRVDMLEAASDQFNLPG